MSAEGEKGGKNWVIVGTSSGIGLGLVQRVLAQSPKEDRVFALCRTRKSSQTQEDSLTALEGAASTENRLTVIEGIDVADDGVGEKLTGAGSPLAGVKIDYLVHNAGSVDGHNAGSREGPPEGKTAFSVQALDTVSMDLMRKAFEVNTLGPLRVQQALNGQMRDQTGKVVVLSTGLSSIADNTSGGTYAYRTSKAAVNMVTKNFACDLKERGIAVVALAPGFVATEFGPGKEKLASWGAMSVEDCTATLFRVAQELGTDAGFESGSFVMIPTKTPAEPKIHPW